MTEAVIVLGAAGFIGRHLAEHLARLGHPVIAATRRPTNFLHPSIKNEVAGYDQTEDHARLLVRSRTVIHAASESTPGSSEARPQLDGNLRATLALLEALQEHPHRRLIYLSSGGTLYGERDDPASESAPLSPRSYHGAGKAAAEFFVQAWAAQYGGTATVLRPSNVYGPGQLPRPGFGIIPTAFLAATRGTPLEIWGTGETVRDYLYIDDFVQLCARAVSSSLEPGTHVFNASTSKGMTLNTLLDEIDRTTTLPVHRTYRPARRVDLRCTLPDSAAARETFNWLPTWSIEDGLASTWQWFQTHADR